jgi:ABC-2 type transport system ATP-binding protein/lipopolysaccharide transport system ATP-binding protein
MQARLAFAISTSIRPDVLIMDEGIGAGDANFMHKATKRLESFMQQVGILVLASHSESVLKDFCNKGVVMHRGRMSRVMGIDEAKLVYDQVIASRDSGLEPDDALFA